MGPFAAGAMLFWGTAAAVPIVLHFLRRRRSRSMRWAAMQFLERAVARRSRQFQLWRWLLLALRVALVLLIAAALARPTLRGEPSSADSRRPNQLRVLVIDQSASMQVREPNGDVRFQRAREAALTVCRNSLAGDGFLLVGMGADAEFVVSEISLRADAVAAQIERLEVYDEPCQVDRALPQITSGVERALLNWDRQQATQSNADARFASIEIFVFSDLQRTTWESRSRSADLPVRLVDRLARWLVVDSGSNGVNSSSQVRESGAFLADVNLVVRELRETARSEVNRGEERDWAVTLAHVAGDTPVDGMLVQLLVDGQIEQTQRVDLSIGESRDLSWTVRLAPGRRSLEVRLGADDLLTLDNRVRCVVDVQSSREVVLLGEASSDTQYVELALQAGGESSIRVRRSSVGALERLEPNGRDVWVLCNPGRLSPSALRSIEQHRLKGGGVVWWLGPAWQQNLIGSDSLVNVIEGQTLGVRDVRSGIVDPLDYQSPLLLPFAAHPGAGLLTLPVFRCWEVELNDHWQVVATIRDDAESSKPIPLLATFQPNANWFLEGNSSGWGRQVLVSTPPGSYARESSSTERELRGDETDIGSDEPWNAMIAWPAFVPLVQEIVAWVSRADGQTESFLAGQVLQGQANQSERSELLISESGRKLSTEVFQQFDDFVLWRSQPARFVGFYHWGQGSQTHELGDVAVAVNPDLQESDLQRLPLIPLPWERFDSGVGELQLSQAGGSDQPTEKLQGDLFHQGAVNAGSEIGWWFLVGALALLLGETVVVRLLERDK